MGGLKFMMCGFAIFLIVAIVAVVVIADLCRTTWYDDAHEDEDKAKEGYSLYITKVEREMSARAKERAEREAYNKCVNHIVIVNSIVSRYMLKIDEYLIKYDLKQFDRFYTVYCKELANTLDSIDGCVSTSLYSDLVSKTRDTYGGIFSKMLADIETFIKNNSVSVTDIEGIKNFAKINGDFDENYKTEAVSKPVSGTDVTLISTTSAVDNKVNYADALVRAYEKISQCKKEKAQLAKELEKCKAEAKGHCANDELSNDLTRLTNTIYCREHSGRNDATLALMRTTRTQIMEYVAHYGTDSYDGYRLHVNGRPVKYCISDWEYETIDCDCNELYR